MEAAGIEPAQGFNRDERAEADYNHRGRHSALGYQAPAVYAAARTHP